MSEVCNDVCIEPPLQPLEGETLHGATSIKEDGARLDIAANGFWRGRYEEAFLMSEYLIYMPYLTVNRAYLRHTGNMSMPKSVPMKSE